MPTCTDAVCAGCGTCSTSSNGEKALLQCGRCRNTGYCTKACQSDHWPVHRPVCSPNFEQFETRDGRGMALRARRPMKRGEEVMRESPTMRLPSGQAASSREQAEEIHKRSVDNAFENLSASKQKAFMSLSVNGGVVCPHSVYQTNSYRLEGREDEKDGAVFIGMARINHSCRPNVNHVWRPDLQRSVVFCTRDVAAGEELLTTYGPSECLDTDGRRSYLNETFAFECECEMCQEGNSSGGDDRMVKINHLQSSVATLVQDAKYREAIEAIDECVELLQEQRIGSGVFTKPLFRMGYQVAAMGLKDGQLAREYLLKETLAVIESEGIGCPNAIRLQTMMGV